MLTRNAAVRGLATCAVPIRERLHVRLDVLLGDHRHYIQRRVNRPRSVFLKLLYISQLPHKFVHLSFIITNMENKLTDLCWN